jgi:hypothetical protein
LTKLTLSQLFPSSLPAVNTVSLFNFFVNRVNLKCYLIVISNCAFDNGIIKFSFYVFFYAFLTFV